MAGKLKISDGKGKADFKDVQSYTRDNSISGKVTGYGAAAFGIPFLEGGNSVKLGTPKTGPIASGHGSFCQGITTTASGMGAMATGEASVSSGEASFTAGKETKASANFAFALGQESEASGEAAFAGGKESKASGESSIALGKNVSASAAASVALGQDVFADEAGQVVVGGPAAEPFKVSNGADLFKVDNQGTATTKKDMKVTEACDIGKSLKVGQGGTFGQAVVAPAFVTGGGDYAEYFEWLDGNPDNEDRRGLFVTMDGDKIAIAQSPDDYILGVVSTHPSIVGNYDSNYEALPMWSPVGMIGKLILKDDATCVVNGYCCPSVDGIATASVERTRYRVIKRLAPNLVQVIIL